MRFTTRLRALTVVLSCVGFTLSPSGHSESGQVAEPGPLAGLEAELGSLVPMLLEAFAVPGAAVGIIHEGDILMARGFGYADVESSRQVDAGTAFNIGSISKTVAAWGVLKLVEAGDLDLDAPASTYLTRWRLPESAFDHDGVTVRRMLSHTAGLSLSGYPGFQPGEPLPTVEESLSGATNGAGGVYVAHEPGSRWQYSGGGYTLAQLIVEEVTRRPFAEYMESEVLAPLGMRSSSFVWDEDVDRVAATPYGSVGEPIGGPRFTAMAAAGLQTTLDDITRFALAGLGGLGGDHGTGGVLGPETLALMQLPVEPADDYGLGYSYEVRGGATLVGHGGANQGWMALLSLAPETGDGLVVMTNGSNGAGVHGVIACAWRSRVTGEACDPPPPIPVPFDEASLARLAGWYAAPDGRTIELRPTAGRLVLHLPNGLRSLVLARGDDEFFTAAAPLTFVAEQVEDGAVSGLMVSVRGETPVLAARVDGPQRR